MTDGGARMIAEISPHAPQSGLQIAVGARVPRRRTDGVRPPGLPTRVLVLVVLVNEIDLIKFTHHNSPLFVLVTLALPRSDRRCKKLVHATRGLRSCLFLHLRVVKEHLR